MQSRARRALIGMLAVMTAVAGLTLSPPETDARRSQARYVAWRIFRTLPHYGYRVRWQYGMGLVRRGGQATRSVTLFRGVDYYIIAAGCFDAYDVDIAVRDEWGRLVGWDTKYSRYGVVRVRPRWTGRFRVTVRMSNSTYDGAHWVLMIASK